MEARNGCLFVVACIVVAAQTFELRAGRVSVEITSALQPFVVVNTNSHPIKPRLIARGWTGGRTNATHTYATGLTLTNTSVKSNSAVALFPARMLTGGTWILNPDGSARWGYRSGAWHKADGAPDDPRLLVWDPDKMDLDHYPPRSLGTWGSPHMRIASGGVPVSWTCRVEFPAGFVVTNFAFAANGENAFGQHVAPIVRIYADPAMQQLVAERLMDPNTGSAAFGQRPQLPNVFYVQMTATNIPAGVSTFLYWTYFWADLTNASGPLNLTLQPGTNVIVATDAADSSHQWRVILDDAGIRNDPPVPALDLPASGNPPPFVQEHRSRFRRHPAAPQTVVAPTNIFPLGFYYSPDAHSPSIDYEIDDMVDLNCNAIHGSNMGGISALAEVLDLLERTPLKLVYQGGSSGALYYQSRLYSGPAMTDATVKWENEYNAQCFIPAATSGVPSIASRPGNAPALLAWSLTEEVPSDVPARMHSYYDLMRRLDPGRAVAVLHNSLEAAAADVATNRPSFITTDLYPFGLDAMSLPDSTDRSLGSLLGRCAAMRKICDLADIPFWYMAQSVSCPASEDYTSPPYGRCYGMRALSLPLVRLQGWAAIAEGARGLWFFIYRMGPSADPYTDNSSACRNADWTKNEPVWNGVKLLFGEVKPIAPLLLRLKRAETNDAQVFVAAPLIARAFTRRDTAVEGLYAVVVNTSDTTCMPLALGGSVTNGAAVVWDVKRGRAASDVVLEPGEGTLVWLGAKAQVRRDRKLCH